MKYIKNDFIKSSVGNSEVIDFLFQPKFTYEYKGDNLEDFDNYFTDDVLKVDDVSSSLEEVISKFLSDNVIKLEGDLTDKVEQISLSWNKEDFNLVVSCELAEGVIAEEILPELKEVIVDQVAKNMDSEEIEKQEVFAVKSDEMVEFFSDKDDAEKRVGELESENYEVVEGEVTIFVSFDELKSAVVNEKAITSKREIQSSSISLDNDTKKLLEGDEIESSVDIDKLWEIADRYNTSKPVSGDWNTETEHELNAISKELGISKQEAKNLMIRELGFDDSVFDNDGSVNLNQSKKTIKSSTYQFICEFDGKYAPRVLTYIGKDGVCGWGDYEEKSDEALSVSESELEKAVKAVAKNEDYDDIEIVKDNGDSVFVKEYLKAGSFDAAWKKAIEDEENEWKIESSKKIQSAKKSEMIYIKNPDTEEWAAHNWQGGKRELFWTSDINDATSFGNPDEARSWPLKGDLYIAEDNPVLGVKLTSIRPYDDDEWKTIKSSFEDEETIDIEDVKEEWTNEGYAPDVIADFFDEEELYDGDEITYAQERELFKKMEKYHLSRSAEFSSRKQIKSSYTSWDDFYKKGCKLGLSSYMNSLDELHDKYGRFRDAPKEELSSILKSIPDDNYEVFLFVEDMLDYFDWYDVINSSRAFKIKSSTHNDKFLAEKIVADLNNFAFKHYDEENPEFYRKYGRMFNFKYRVEDDGTVVIYDEQGSLDLFDENSAITKYIEKKCNEMGGYSEPYDNCASFTIAEL